MWRYGLALLVVYGRLAQQCSRGDEVRVTCLDRGLQDEAALLVHIAGIDEYHVRFLDRTVQVKQCEGDREKFETHPNCIFTNEEVRRAACGDCESGPPCAVEDTEPVYVPRDEAPPVEQAWIPSGAAFAIAGVAATCIFFGVTRWVFQKVGADLGEDYEKHAWAYAGTSPAAAALARFSSGGAKERARLEEAVTARRENPRCAWPAGEKLRIGDPSSGPPVIAWEAPGASAGAPSRYRPSVRPGERRKPPPLQSV
jgi:hypothetical protein